MSFNARKSVMQRLISISWIAIGYKFYIQGIFTNNIKNNDHIFFNSQSATFIVGLINILVGLLLFTNYIELIQFYSASNNCHNSSLITRGFNFMKKIINFLFLNYSFGYFRIDEVVNFDNLDFIKNLINFTVLALNTFPLLANYSLDKNIMKIPVTVYPSSMVLITLTIFLNLIRHSQPGVKYLVLIDTLCYMLLILNFINDIFFVGVFSYSHLFYLVLNILNVILINYYDVFELSTGKKYFLL